MSSTSWSRWRKARWRPVVLRVCNRSARTLVSRLVVGRWQTLRRGCDNGAETALGCRSRWGRALGLGFTFAPLGGLVGTLIMIGVSLIFDGVRTNALELFITVGLVMGTLRALLATVVVFPLLYVVWPTRGVRSFILVLVFSAVGGFVSPYPFSPRAWTELTNTVNVAPDYNVWVDQRTHVIHMVKNNNPRYVWRPQFDRSLGLLGLLGLSAAALLMPFYFMATRPPRTAKT